MVPDIESSAPKPRLTEMAVTVLRDRIRDGKYGAGEWLPAERELTDDLNVHRRVVRAAISQLEKEGLLIRRRFCRPIVQSFPIVGPPVTDIPVAASKFVALVMHHGGSLERNDSAQQRIFWGMNQALGRAGYHAVFPDLGTEVGTPEENASSEAAQLRYVIDHRFGGVVFYPCAYYNNRDLIREVSRKMPLVLIDRMLSCIDSDFVGVQNHQATFVATKYLVGLGHKRIAYVTKPEPINTVYDRLQGYLHGLQDGLGTDFYEMVLSIPSVGDTWPVFDTVFGLPAGERPTAAICVNDYEAVRVTDRLKLLNLNVPHDVSIIGCDDIVQKLPGGTSLTSIAQPFEEIGKEATRLLLRRIVEPASFPSHVELPVQLVVRESTISA
jgi:GntR family transcriptional regulator, arabinose operon transcriptional repressor